MCIRLYPQINIKTQTRKKAARFFRALLFFMQSVSNGRANRTLTMDI